VPSRGILLKKRRITGPGDLLAEGLEDLGIRPEGLQIRAFMAYLAELKKWGRAHNLTSLRTERDIIIKHFLDSAVYLKGVGRGVRSLADVGSGAGFPGLPIKILRPDVRVYLIEPTGKKAAFLRNVIRRLGLLDVSVIEGRVEDVEGVRAGAVVTRALFSAGELVMKASHIVEAGGVFLLSKGPRVKEELKEISLDFKVMKVLLPHTGVVRNLVIIDAPMAAGARGGSRKSKSMEGRSRGGKAAPAAKDACVNRECKLRRAGCLGYEGCPGFKGK
jgi:16S rRNA (guanine527-N7)-methyltransferase